MSVQALREFINGHSASAAGLAALAAALDARVSGGALDPVVAARVGELLNALGAGDVLDEVSPQEAAPLLAELRLGAAFDAKLLYASTRATGWTPHEPDILQSGGHVSAGFVQPLARFVVPSLDGLAERLSAPGAAFLDVGVGVAGLAIAVARTWPELRIVGIDPWKPALALARANVDEADLAERIELRAQRVEDLEDEGQFDLAWVPTPFIPERVIGTALARVHRALRPGGWVLVNAINSAIDAPSAALWRLRTTLFGNGQLQPGAMEQMVRDAGLVDVRTLPSPPGAFLSLVVGRKSE